MYIFGSKIYLIMYIIEIILKINFYFSIWRKPIRDEILKLMFVQCLKSSMG
jgi:hypothetical protein